MPPRGMRQGWGTPPNTVRAHRREPDQVVHVARERPRRESLYLYAVASGRITHVEMFELDAREAALAQIEGRRPLVPARPH